MQRFSFRNTVIGTAVLFLALCGIGFLTTQTRPDKPLLASEGSPSNVRESYHKGRLTGFSFCIRPCSTVYGYSHPDPSPEQVLERLRASKLVEVQYSVGSNGSPEIWRLSLDSKVVVSTADFERARGFMSAIYVGGAFCAFASLVLALWLLPKDLHRERVEA